jgi:hypothetical protein
MLRFMQRSSQKKLCNPLYLHSPTITQMCNKFLRHTETCLVPSYYYYHVLRVIRGRAQYLETP